jgi:hypothetical protein
LLNNGAGVTHSHSESRAGGQWWGQSCRGRGVGVASRQRCGHSVRHDSTKSKVLVTSVDISSATLATTCASRCVHCVACSSTTCERCHEPTPPPLPPLRGPHDQRSLSVCVTVGVDVVYVRTSFAELPHVSLDFKTVDNTFDPQNMEYVVSKHRCDARTLVSHLSHPHPHVIMPLAPILAHTPWRSALSSP